MINLLLGQGQRQRADFYVENSDASTFKRDKAHEAGGNAQAGNRRMHAQGSSPNGDQLPPDGPENVRSPRRNLHNIAASLVGTLKLGNANLSPSGKFVPPTELQSPSGRKLNGHHQYYSNSDALGSTHNPYFDPNYTLASRSPMAEHGIIPTSPSHPPDSYSMHSPRYDLTTIPGQTRSDPTDRVSTSAADPSRLKHRFDAAYASQPPLANSGRRPSAPRRTSASSISRSSPPGAAPSQMLNGMVNATQVQMRKSYTIGHPTHGTKPGEGMSPPLGDSEHRRRATLDSGDTERSVPRRKGYMYRTSEALIADGVRLQPLQAGIAAYPETHRNAKAGFQHRYSSDAAANALSPTAASHANLSPIGLASTASSNSYSGSPKQRSPLSDRLSVPNSSPQIPQMSPSGKPLQHRKASPIPPSPANSPARVRVPSIDSSKGPVVPRELTPALPGRRGSLDRRDFNSRGSPAANSAMPTVYERNTRQGEPTEVRADKSTQSDLRPLEGHTTGAKHSSRSHNKVRTPAQRTDNLDYETPRNIWQTNGPIKPVSTRSSIYTSGESDGGPVIPDASLIMDAVIMRARDKPHRRQLVPFLSSSEENTSYRPTDVDTDFTSESSDSEDRRGRQTTYGRIQRDRDGYTSEAGSVAGSVRSRASSRPPSRPPSRGILKRSNSTCSQRSAKSVRLEITEDRVALEEAREAEEAVNKASEYIYLLAIWRLFTEVFTGDKLKEVTRKKALGIEGADLDFYKANEQLKSAESIMEVKVVHYEDICTYTIHDFLTTH